MKKLIRNIASGDRLRYKQDGHDLDLTYVTPRIIGMSYPASEQIQKIYRNDAADVANLLESKHGKKYWVFNLSE